MYKFWVWNVVSADNLELNIVPDFDLNIRKQFGKAHCLVINQYSATTAQRITEISLKQTNSTPSKVVIVSDSL